MARFALKPLLGAIAGATALSCLSPAVAEAAVLRYGFDVTINRGTNAGSNFRGTFEFDDSKLVPCVTAPGNLCATPGDSALRVVFDFMGQRYTEKSDVDYNGRPEFRIPPLKFASLYFIPTLREQGLEPYVLSLLVMAPETQTNFAVLGQVFSFGFPKYSDPMQVGTAEDPTFQVGSVRYTRLPDTRPTDPSPCKTDPDSCNPAAVPEPSEIAGSVVAVGLLGLFWRSRRKKSALKL